MYADICFHCETRPCGYTICVSDLNLSTGTLPPCKENARRHIRPGQANRKWEEVLLRRRQSIPLRSLWVITGLAVSFASASPPASYLSWVGARPRGTMAHKGRSEFRFPSDCVCVSRVLKGKKGRGLFICLYTLLYALYFVFEVFISGSGMMRGSINVDIMQNIVGKRCVLSHKLWSFLGVQGIGSREKRVWFVWRKEYVCLGFCYWNLIFQHYFCYESENVLIRDLAVSLYLPFTVTKFQNTKGVFATWAYVNRWRIYTLNTHHFAVQDSLVSAELSQQSTHLLGLYVKSYSLKSCSRFKWGLWCLYFDKKYITVRMKFISKSRM